MAARRRGSGSTMAGILDVHVHHAEELQNQSTHSEQDVYARFLFGDPDPLSDAVLQTKTIRKGGRRPIFDQTLQIGVPEGMQFLRCELFAAQPRGRDHLLGSVQVALDEIILRRSSRSRKPTTYRLVSGHLDAHAGCIILTLAFHGRRRLRLDLSGIQSNFRKIAPIMRAGSLCVAQDAPRATHQQSRHSPTEETSGYRLSECSGGEGDRSASDILSTRQTLASRQTWAPHNAGVSDAQWQGPGPSAALTSRSPTWLLGHDSLGIGLGFPCVSQNPQRTGEEGSRCSEAEHVKHLAANAEEVEAGNDDSQLMQLLPHVKCKEEHEVPRMGSKESAVLMLVKDAPGQESHAGRTCSSAFKPYALPFGAWTEHVAKRPRLLHGSAHQEEAATLVSNICTLDGGTSPLGAVQGQGPLQLCLSEKVVGRPPLQAGEFCAYMESDPECEAERKWVPSRSYVQAPRLSHVDKNLLKLEPPGSSGLPDTTAWPAESHQANDQLDCERTSKFLVRTQSAKVGEDQVTPTSVLHSQTSDGNSWHTDSAASEQLGTTAESRSAKGEMPSGLTQAQLSYFAQWAAVATRRQESPDRNASWRMSMSGHEGPCAEHDTLNTALDLGRVGCRQERSPLTNISSSVTHHGIHTHYGESSEGPASAFITGGPSGSSQGSGVAMEGIIPILQRQAAAVWRASQALTRQPALGVLPATSGPGLQAQIDAHQRVAAIWQATMGMSKEEMEWLWQQSVAVGAISPEQAADFKQHMAREVCKRRAQPRMECEKESHERRRQGWLQFWEQLDIERRELDNTSGLVRYGSHAFF